MTVSELHNLVRTANWFANLGGGSPTSGVAAITDPDHWKRYVSSATAAEFGLPHDEVTLDDQVLRQMIWLPTTSSQEDPVHGNSLAVLADERGEGPKLRAARAEITRLVLKSLRPIPTPPLLVVGPTSFEGAAHGAAQFAFRQAVSELLLERKGFWCSLAELYHAGHWPIGRLLGGRVVIL